MAGFKYLKLVTVEEALALIRDVPPVREVQELPLEEALGRVLAVDLFSPEDLPHFRRATMDGYALRARDTFGASASNPGILEVIGEVRMGEEAVLEPSPGQAVAISTGGMLPRETDAVLMVEHSQEIDQGLIEVLRPVAVGENVIEVGEDVREGTLIFEAGRRLRPADLGLLAGLGVYTVKVRRPLRVGVISTGDEVIEGTLPPPPGKIRDVNRYSVSAIIRALGHIPIYLGRSKDDFEALKELLNKGLLDTDLLLISGGSSVGTRDLTIRVLESFEGFRPLCHGVMISPGKPTILGLVRDRLVIGLPGHVASAFVISCIIVRPAIRSIAGMGWKEASFYYSVWATTTRNIESQSGREDYVRVMLFEKEGVLYADPVFGKSGLISTVVEGDGLMRIPLNQEGVYEGEKVQVIPFGPLLGDV